MEHQTEENTKLKTKKIMIGKKENPHTQGKNLAN